MPPRRPKFDRLKQPVPEDLRDSILMLLKSKFYGGPDQAAEAQAFAQDRKRLLGWVVLWPAKWLDDRAATIHGDAYREIFNKVFLQAAAHMASKVKYRPAYLMQVIQSHFRIHGEDYLDQAKAIRAVADHALFIAGQARHPAPDPVAELAKAKRLLDAPKRKKTVINPPLKTQLSLWG